MYKKLFLSATAALAFAASAWATPIAEYANSVLSFSSEWSSGEHLRFAPSWTAIMALGAPDTYTYVDDPQTPDNKKRNPNGYGYGDIPNAWAPSSKNGTYEYIALGFLTPVYATSLDIWETWGNGFVYQVDFIDLSHALHTVWTGTDPSSPGEPEKPSDFNVPFTPTSYLVNGVTIYINTNHNMCTWEEIDAAQLSGNVPVPDDSSSLILLSIGLALLAGLAVVARRTPQPIQ